MIKISFNTLITYAFMHTLKRPTAFLRMISSTFDVPLLEKAKSFLGRFAETNNLMRIVFTETA